MVLKDSIENEVAFILKSAIDRNTNQGRLVCTKTLEALASCQSNAELADLLEKFNQAFIGIDTHGYLTSGEFEAVKRLREIGKDAGGRVKAGPVGQVIK